jgi:mono/diheme cytochrome c family protein
MKSWGNFLVTVFLLSLMGLTGCGGGGTDYPVFLTSTTIPTAPVASAVGGNNQVTVSWAVVSGATSYNIYWSTTTGVTKATGTKIAGASSPYVQTGLTTPATYYYVVTAVNSAGESADSAQVSATTASGVLKPSAPTGLTAIVGATTVANTNQVNVSWTAVSGATSYNIYWSTTSGAGTGGTKLPGVISPYVQMGLSTTPTTYYYVATAVNTAGESLPSAQASVATLNGAALYVTNGTSGTNCGSCHGPLATSDKRGRTATQIQNAINANRGGMGEFSAFTAAQVQAIANTLFP